MKKIIPYLFIIGLLASCKTTDRFSIHKRKYNTGFYIEKTSVTVKPQPSVQPKNTVSEIHVLTKNQAAFINTITAMNTAVDKFIPTKKAVIPSLPKTTFTKIQQKHIASQETVRLSDKKNISSTKSVGSKKLKRDFIAFLGAFLLTILVIVLLTCLIAGIYLVGLAANAASVLLGWKLLSIALSLLATCTYIVFQL